VPDGFSPALPEILLNLSDAPSRLLHIRRNVERSAN
jgi:hypothetical protein